MSYDDWSSGAIIYAYVGGNPLSYTDPDGRIVQALPYLVPVVIVGCALSPGCRDWLKNQMQPKPLASSPLDGDLSWPSFPPFRPTATPDADKEAHDKCQAAYEAQIEVCKMTSSTPRAREACYARAVNQYGECIKKNCR
ncbi:hypothetical protein [Roseateles sp.]|uniref:hypothetical protein n=1 Tax=Roseateles sp. TaxID=1971397 RepID=UPI0032661306